MLLFIVRHAWAGDSDDPKYPDDSLRPLTDAGRKRFTQVVQRLADRGFAPTLIASSPLVRCRQTAEIVAQLTAGKPQTVLVDALQPGSDLNALLVWTSEQGERDIAWVGHGPDVGRLAASMIGDGSGKIRMAKGSVACLRFEGGIHRGKGELQWLATAKLLGC